MRAFAGYMPQNVSWSDSKARGIGVERRYMSSLCDLMLGMNPSWSTYKCLSRWPNAKVVSRPLSVNSPCWLIPVSRLCFLPAGEPHLPDTLCLSSRPGGHYSLVVGPKGFHLPPPLESVPSSDVLVARGHLEHLASHVAVRPICEVSGGQDTDGEYYMEQALPWWC